MRNRLTALTPLLIGLIVLLIGCSRSAPEMATVPATESVPVTPETTSSPPTQIQMEEIPMETQPQLLLDPKNTDLVRVRDYIPDILEELFYATDNNFTGSVIYNFQEVYLRYGTVKKLAAVQQDLKQLDLGLKLWDGFRPVSAQFRLWEICPDDT